jgi:hypothetical protein
MDPDQMSQVPPSICLIIFFLKIPMTYLLLVDLVHPIKKPLSEFVSSDSGPTIPLFNLQK